MASAQEQVEQFFAKLDGGIESMLIDYGRETTLAEYSLYGAPRPRRIWPGASSSAAKTITV